MNIKVEDPFHWMVGASTPCKLVVNLFLILLSCMTLDKLFNFSEPQFLLCTMGTQAVYMELSVAMGTILIRQSAWHVVVVAGSVAKLCPTLL